MATGDNDLPIFFRDGDPVSFGGVSTYANGQPIKGHVYQVGKSAQFGGLDIQDSDVRCELPWNAFSPFPAGDDTLIIQGGRLAGTYTVRSVDPIEDGSTQELRLEQTT